MYGYCRVLLGEGGGNGKGGVGKEQGGGGGRKEGREGKQMRGKGRDGGIVEGGLKEDRWDEGREGERGVGSKQALTLSPNVHFKELRARGKRL